MAKKCELWKKGGERCNADAQTGKRVCVFHDPNKASDGRRARRAGGITRSRAATVLPFDTPDHPLGDTKPGLGFVGRLHQSASPRANRSARSQCDGLPKPSLSPGLYQRLFATLKDSQEGGTQ
jgi:hypothetical protein